MAAGYKAGDKAYIVESNRIVRECTVVRPAGNLIIINHGNGLLTYYMHCNTIFVSAGQKVSKGQNIGQVGTTGNSTGPHLHFHVMNNGTPVNPMNYL